MTVFHRSKGVQIIAGSLLAFGAVAAQADERKFTFTYETTTMPAGHAEYEQWVTWKTHKESDHDFDRFDFRHELEFGITDNFQLGLYLSDWRYQDGKSVADDGADWRNVGVEAIYALTNPNTDPLGIALYGEVKYGGELIVIEPKLLLQKNVGKWIFAFNGIVEAEWEHAHYDEDKAEFGATLGASYQFSPGLAAGVEAIYEIEYDDWSQFGDDVVYVGPVLSYANKKWWFAITPTIQVTDVAGEADYQTRLLVGINF